MFDIALLSICAILGEFDAELLSALESGSQPEIFALLASELVAPAAGQNAYRLCDDARSAALARLRDERPGDEIMLHERCLGLFLAHMRSSASPQLRQAAEARCFEHLEALRLPLIERRDWQRLRQLAADIRAAEPQEPRHLQRLLLLDGLVAVHSQSYELGEQLLTTLLGQPEIEDEVRMRALTILAHAQWYRTNYDRALGYYQQVHARASAIGHRLFQGHALLNMSMIYHELGYYAQALELSEQSLAHYEAQGDQYLGNHARYEVGKNAMQLGRWRDAQRYFQAALALYERLGVQAQIANLYCLQGMLHHALGDEIASETFYLRSIDIGQTSEHGDNAVLMDAWLLLGLLYQTQTRWQLAHDALERAISLAQGLRNLHSLSLIHYRRGQVLQRQGQPADALAAYLAAIDGVEALGGATESEEIKIGLLGTTQQIYEAAVLLLLDLGRPAEAFHYAERARSRAFLDALAKKAPDLSAAFDRSVCTLADVQAQLPADALLLEYFTTGVLPVGEHMLNRIPESNARLREHLTLPPQAILFAVARDRLEVHRLALNPNSLRPPEADPYPGRHLLHGRLPQHLYARLIAPAEHLLDGRAALYLVPHGPLHYVPFTGLRSGAGEYLVRAGGPALAHAPSATVLLRRCLGRAPSPALGALAIGFDDPQGEQPLRFAEAEAHHVARLLGGEVWAGPAPKSDRLAAAGPRLRWLHIAGHARFSPRDPLGSELYLGAGDALSARAIMRDLNLAADLVTLSSCTSGISHVVPGDELLGLQRALLYAGAPTVVCTRWEAYDLVALLVMDYFYGALRQGAPPAAALRDAQVTVRDMTAEDLAALLERWQADSPDLAAALGPHTAALGALRAAARQIRQVDLGPLLASWRGGAPDMAAALDQPEPVRPRAEVARPFADPLLWAPFMLVGRA